MEFKERIRDLIKRDFDNTASKMSEVTGISEATISRWLNGEGAKPSNVTVNKLKGVGVDTDWLFDGKEPAGSNLITPLSNNSKRGVPYFPIDITASFVRTFADIEEKPEFYVDYKPFNDCDAYFPIYGDSMYPMFASGEVIVVKSIKNPNYIQWGEPHLIVTDEDTNNMRTVKLIYPNEDNKETVILRASNPNYKGDLIVPIKSILSLHFVKGKITRRSL